VHLDLTGSPYSLEATGQGVLDEVTELERRVDFLRQAGKLTPATLKAYFGETRFEQIAESNALEGSTLSVGETQLAVLRGITITGHDRAYSKDAVALAKALERITELARVAVPTDLEQLHDVHSLILGDRAGAGIFRSEPVRITGSAHRPPSTWAEIMRDMEAWESWSKHSEAPALLRGVILHTWLTHVHPYIDGNGRTARAMLNLELIRAGLPSAIVRRKDRARYLDALAESDVGGDLGPITDLIIDRAKDALRGLERAAESQQGYSRVGERLREAQERQLAIWNDIVKLLFSLLGDALEGAFGEVGTVVFRWYDDRLQLDDFAALCRNDAAGNSWLSRIRVTVPAVGEVEYLAWTGYRSDVLQSGAKVGPGPSIFWSVRDPTGYRQWVRREEESPGGAELTVDLPDADRWVVRRHSGEIERLPPGAVVRRIVDDIDRAIAGHHALGT
jgi:Fic family protein